MYRDVPTTENDGPEMSLVLKLRNAAHGVIICHLTAEGACDKVSLLSYYFLTHFMFVCGTEVKTF